MGGTGGAGRMNGNERTGGVRVRNGEQVVLVVAVRAGRQVKATHPAPSAEMKGRCRKQQVAQWEKVSGQGV